MLTVLGLFAGHLFASAFHVDLSASGVPFDNGIITRCFGSSHAATALRASWQSQFRQVVSDLGTEHVRFHGLLDDDMSVVVHNTFQDTGATGGFVLAGAAANHTCTFVEDQDYSDPGGGVYNATSKEQCCELCYTASTGLPTPCIAAVWTQDGKCYFKLNSASPYSKPGTGIQSCVTDRKPPSAFSYSFVNIFGVFDFLVEVGVKPIVEIGFMPELLAADASQTVFHYKGGTSPPKDYSDWRNFITALAAALQERYGAAEVRSWKFEVWNEPNCGFYDAGGCCGEACGNQSAYLDMYVNTWQALKKQDPQLSVGGPATAQLSWLDWFVASAVQRGATPDFVSSHLYPTDPHIPQTRDGFGDAIADAAAQVATAATMAKLPVAPPLLITEFNCGLGIKCADAPFAASFVAHQAVLSQRLAGKVSFLSYWTFSDIFEEQGQVASEFSQAFGARSIHGVPKPVYRAMQLLRRLHSTALPTVTVDVDQGGCSNASAIDVVVTTDAAAAEGGKVEALIVNHPGARPDAMSDGSLARENTAQVLGTAGAAALNSTTVTLHFTGDAPNSASVRRVDQNHSNALPMYHSAGAPKYPNATLLRALNAASQIVAKDIAISIINSTSWTITVEMPRYAVAVVSF